MAVCEIHLRHSRSLQKMNSAVVILPEGQKGPFPVWYLLHGLSDDHTVWTRRTSLERYLDGLPLIIVMPNGERSFYTDYAAIPTFRYESYITQDLIEFIDATFQSIPRREGRVISGLSMGGYGSLKLSLKHPDLFCAAVSHSGAPGTARRELLDESDWAIERRAIFGASPEGGENDVFTLAEKVGRDLLPALRIDCGVDDFLIEDNRAFHRHLQALRIPHEYEEFPGEHNWDYWDQRVQEAITFFVRELHLK